MDKIETLKDWIKHAQHIVFFGGAGVSTESGIPDFRSAEGIYNQPTGQHLSAEMIISAPFFNQDPKTFFDFYFDNLVFPNVSPNTTHKYLRHLEQEGKRVSVITQNIDSLHEQAGSQEVYHLHGSVGDNYCLTCGKHYTLDELEKDADGIPRCPEDQGIVRPAITLYGEQLPEADVTGAIMSLRSADLLIVAGTSLQVYPAAGFIDEFHGDKVAVINQTAIPMHRPNQLVFQSKLGDVMKELVE